MRLLCATDLSSRSDRALRRAAMLAREADAALTILSVVDDDQPAVLVARECDEVATLLAGQVHGMPEMQGLAPHLRVEPGNAFDAIIRAAAAEEADLVVMGEHRRRLLRDMFVGTTIERVMRLGHRPVLMVKRPTERAYRRVLAAVDVSAASMEALRVAVGLGFPARGELTVFHAFEQPGRGSMMMADLPPEVVQGHVATTLVDARAEVVRLLRGIDLGFGSRLPAVVLEEGAPAEALRRIVERTSPDLVVIGTRGRGAIGRLLLGSVAEATLRTLDCDVLVVPPAA